MIINFLWPLNHHLIEFRVREANVNKICKIQGVVYMSRGTIIISEMAFTVLYCSYLCNYFSKN